MERFDTQLLRARLLPDDELPQDSSNEVALDVQGVICWNREQSSWNSCASAIIWRVVNKSISGGGRTDELHPLSSLEMVIVLIWYASCSEKFIADITGPGI